MKLVLKRKWPRDKYIIGQLYADDRLICHTLEPPKSAAHPCIPKGTYEVQMYPSAKFRGMRPILLNVPKRSGILIHEGNFPRDTQGCILVGKNLSIGSLSYSKNTLDEVISLISHSDKTSITIEEGF